MDQGNIFSGGSFRATLYGALIFLVVLALCAILTLRFVETELRADIRAQLSLAIDSLKPEFDLGGPAELAESVRQMSAVFARTKHAVALYDAQGHRVAGQQDLPSGFTGWAELDVSTGTDSKADEFYITTAGFGDMTLVIGRDIAFVRRIEKITVQAFLLVGAVMTLVLIAIGFLISRQVQSKLDAMSETLHRVALGETDARLELSPDNDQIDRITRIMNQHLETLSDLMRSTKSSATAIAHDLKRPLTRACLGLESVQDDVTLSERTRTRIEETRAELAHLAEIFETILRIARIDAARGQALGDLVDLGQLVSDLGETYEVVAEESGQTLVLDIPDGVGLVVPGDAGMIGQIIVNLVQNAISHCPPGTFVTLGVEGTADQVLISVSDTGPGIAKPDRDRIFDRFFRTDMARTTEGNGLGMALVKSMADHHKAPIVLADNAPGLKVTVGFWR